MLLKATEGVNYTDPCFKANIKAAIAAGLPVGAYHFLRSTPIDQQCRDFLAAVKPYKLTWPAAVDVEHNELSALGRGKLTDMVLNFCARVKAAGYQPMVYSNRNWFYLAKLLDIGRIRAAGIPVWLAWYTNATPANTDRSALCDMWQYASDGQISGIAGHPVDLNVSYRDFGARQTSVQIDTTCDVTIPHGGYYTFKTVSGQQPVVTIGTPGVVALLHCRREMEADYWHLCAVGKPGAEAGVYTAAPGEQPLKRFVVKIK